MKGPSAQSVADLAQVPRTDIARCIGRLNVSTASWRGYAWNPGITSRFAAASMFSPFPSTKQNLSRHFQYHVNLAPENGKGCIGELGSPGLFQHNHMNHGRDIDFQPK